MRLALLLLVAAALLAGATQTRSLRRRRHHQAAHTKPSQKPVGFQAADAGGSSSDEKELDEAAAEALDNAYKRFDAFQGTGEDELIACKTVLKAVLPRVGAHSGFSSEQLLGTLSDHGCHVYRSKHLTPSWEDLPVLDEAIHNGLESLNNGMVLTEHALRAKGYSSPTLLTKRQQKAINLLTKPHSSGEATWKRLGITSHVLPERLTGEDLYMEQVEEQAESEGELPPPKPSDTIGRDVYGRKRTETAEDAAPSLEVSRNLPAKEWSRYKDRWLAMTRRPLRQELKRREELGQESPEVLIPALGPQKPIGAMGRCANKWVHIRTEDQHLVGAWDVHLPEFFKRVESMIYASSLMQTADQDTEDSGRISGIKAYWAYTCGRVHRQGVTTGWPDPASLLWVDITPEKQKGLRLAARVMYETCLMDGEGGSTLYAWAHRRFCNPRHWG